MENEHTERRKDYSEIKTTVAEHSIHITSLGEALKDLAVATEHTNKKLDKVAEALSTQSVIMEKLNNLDENIRDSFKRRDDRLLALETTQSGNGCAKLNVAEESIKSLGRSIDTLKAMHKSDDRLMSERVDKLESKTDSIVSATTIKWAIGITIAAVITFIGFVNTRYFEINSKVNNCVAREAGMKVLVETTRQMQERNALYYKESLRRIEKSLAEAKR